MKVAIVYNRDTKNVINLFGIPNREKIGHKTIKRIAEALRAKKHQVKAFEGDKDLVDRLEEFMPRVVKGERPGLVFNVSYGIQGQARYTHVPGILEMVGIPYVGSGPLAHGLALDKVVAKMLFRQHGLPTPEFAVLDSWEEDLPELRYPLIVKPKNEAVSFGIKVAQTEAELREGVRVILEKFQQSVLVEHYIEGQEINVGLLGNNPPEVLPPVELVFGEGPQIYTYEDKTRASGREIEYRCPAQIGEALTEQARHLARRAFEVLGCYDCARVDMRLDKEGNLYLLEVNSLPSLGEHGSYLVGAAEIGLDFGAVINRLVEAASARYFGTPKPMMVVATEGEAGGQVHGFLTQRRDQIERRVEGWTNLRSRTDDPVGIQEAGQKLRGSFESIGLTLRPEYLKGRIAGVWSTRAGLEGGTLFIGHLDVPLERGIVTQRFRRDPEWLYGEGIGLSRSPLVMLEYTLRALKHVRQLQDIPLGVLYYTDEGWDGSISAETIREVAGQAGQVFVLRPGNPANKIITQRRGQRKYRLTVEASPRRLGKITRNPGALRWTCEKLGQIAQLTSREERMAVEASEVKTTHYPLLLPHQVEVILLVSYVDPDRVEAIEGEIRDILGKGGVRWELELLSDRPPMPNRKGNRLLTKALSRVAEKWDIALAQESSLWPTIAGVVPASVPVICGIGPVAQHLYTPQESVQRISLLQRTLLLTEFLLEGVKGSQPT